MFPSDDNIKLTTAWAKYLSAPERSYWVLSENGMVNKFWSYHSWDIVVEILPKKLTKPCIFKGWQLANDSSEPNQNPIIHSIFWMI